MASTTGGGLIAGVGAYVKALRPEIKVIGVQTKDSDAMAQSLKAGHRVRLQHVGLSSDTTAVRLVGKETFRLCQRYVDQIVTVDTDALCAAIKDVFQETRSILEPAGALAVAGAKVYAARTSLAGKTVVAVACGANMNFDRLRFVAERAEVGENREALFAVTIPEARGSFRRLCGLLGDRSVTEFNYRIADSAVAHVFVGVPLARKDEAGGRGGGHRTRVGRDSCSDTRTSDGQERHLLGDFRPPHGNLIPPMKN